MFTFIKIFVLTLSLLALTACGGGGVAEQNNTKEEKNIPPMAKAKVTPARVLQGDAVSFDASGSNDRDGTIVSYLWKDGATTLSTKISFTISTLTVGSHNIILTVTDDDNSINTDSVTVTVENSNVVTKQPKKTGQNKSYNPEGHEVNDGSLKDDGYYQKGVEPSYSRDDDTNIVIDYITGLEWEDDENVYSIRKRWLTEENYNTCTGEAGRKKDSAKCYDTSGDTASTYCANLTLGGHKDWRLPTIKELLTLVDLGKSDPSIDTTVFKDHNLIDLKYWSSTTSSKNKEDAWFVDFSGGDDFSFGKSTEYRVRCVRAKK